MGCIAFSAVGRTDVEEDPPPASKIKRGHAPMPMHAASKLEGESSKAQAGIYLQCSGRQARNPHTSPHLSSPYAAEATSPHLTIHSCNATHTHTCMHVHTSLSNIIFTLINLCTIYLLEVGKKLASVYIYMHAW